MISFKEFLEKKADQRQYKERRERRQEWIAAVGRLMDQLRGWLTESDPVSVLDVVPIELEKAEPGLGAYRITGMKINLGDSSVQVVPVSRSVVGAVSLLGAGEIRAEGRVDITDGFRKRILYRTLKDGLEKWYALDEQFQAAPLNKDRLETILQELLS